MIKENLIKTLAGLAILFLALAVLGYWFEEDMRIATNWVVDRIGFAGLCLILLVTDTLVTPFSPDILLIVIAKSDLADNWFPYVLILSLISVIAGMLGWCIGRRLAHLKLVQKLYGQFNEGQRNFIQQYGFWAIVLGAATPLPYSATCWAAGIMRIEWTTVLAASLFFRIPRVIVYYLVIASTSRFY